MFYRDQFGDIDVGFEKGVLGLKISQEWVGKIIDTLLSSAWVDQVLSAPSSFGRNQFIPLFLRNRIGHI